MLIDFKCLWGLYNFSIIFCCRLKSRTLCLISILTLAKRKRIIINISSLLCWVVNFWRGLIITFHIIFKHQREARVSENKVYYFFLLLYENSGSLKITSITVRWGASYSIKPIHNQVAIYFSYPFFNFDIVGNQTANFIISSCC